MNRSMTDRGFAIYDELYDASGCGIRVQESSSAEEPHVWIFVDGTLHLNVEQARRVRDALDAFIREHQEASR